MFCLVAPLRLFPSLLTWSRFGHAFLNGLQGFRGKVCELVLPWFSESFVFRKVSCKFFFARNRDRYAGFESFLKIIYLFALQSDMKRRY